tara:strand:+ start:5879 stop:6280 length:402 start_codon:yes stop_codon:yes gene_type:complete
MIEFPTIDGHFWLERGGKKVDIEFKDYDFIKRVHNCDDGMVYKEADFNTQLIMIKIFEKCLYSMEKDIEAFKTFSKSMGISPMMGCCFQNSMMAYEDGDLIKFGSMGWNKKNNGGVWWEFGGEDWKGVKAFLK